MHGRLFPAVPDWLQQASLAAEQSQSFTNPLAFHRQSEDSDCSEDQPSTGGVAGSVPAWTPTPSMRSAGSVPSLSPTPSKRSGALSYSAVSGRHQPSPYGGQKPSPYLSPGNSSQRPVLLHHRHAASGQQQGTPASVGRLAMDPSPSRSASATKGAVSSARGARMSPRIGALGPHRLSCEFEEVGLEMADNAHGSRPPGAAAGLWPLRSYSTTQRKEATEGEDLQQCGTHRQQSIGAGLNLEALRSGAPEKRVAAASQSLLANLSPRIGHGRVMGQDAGSEPRAAYIAIDAQQGGTFEGLATPKDAGAAAVPSDLDNQRASPPGFVRTYDGLEWASRAQQTAAAAQGSDTHAHASEPPAFNGECYQPPVMSPQGTAVTPNRRTSCEPLAGSASQRSAADTMQPFQLPDAGSNALLPGAQGTFQALQPSSAASAATRSGSLPVADMMPSLLGSWTSYSPRVIEQSPLPAVRNRITSHPLSMGSMLEWSDGEAEGADAAGSYALPDRSPWARHQAGLARPLGHVHHVVRPIQYPFDGAPRDLDLQVGEAESADDVVVRPILSDSDSEAGDGAGSGRLPLGSA